jgi:hypothetical protein
VIAGYLLGSRIPDNDTYLLPTIAVVVLVWPIPVGSSCAVGADPHNPDRAR